jgi:hypothetical protein
MLIIIMIDNYQIQTKSAESYWIFDVSSETQNVIDCWTDPSCQKKFNNVSWNEHIYKEHWTKKSTVYVQPWQMHSWMLSSLPTEEGGRTWHYMGTSTELTAGNQTKYSGDAPYQNVLLPCQQRTTYRLVLEDSNTITEATHGTIPAEK